MRYILSLLLTIALICLASQVHAKTGFFYNPERTGEGIIVTVEGDTLAFAFFTYFDPSAVNEIPPTVSPPAPDVDIVLPECIVEITTLPGVEIPPVVSPRPPPGEEVDVETELHGGVPVWYIGFGAYADGMALGKMYYHKPISYPYSFDSILSNGYEVATFLMDGNGEGFELHLDCNQYLPTGLYMCNNVMTFNTLIIGE